MKLLHVIHAAVTLLLVLAIVAFGVLVVTGIIQVRLPGSQQQFDPLVAKQNSRPSLKEAGVQGRLVVVRGLKVGTEFPIYVGDNIIGRADEKAVDVDIADQEPQDRVWSSRQHALIRCANGLCDIEDLNSTNGTYVNRDRVPPGTRRELKTNDFIQIGAVQLQVTLQGK